VEDDDLGMDYGQLLIYTVAHWDHPLCGTSDSAETDSQQ
jgi:hypothetical protein